MPDTLLAHLAPLGWQHINLTGDYLWDADGERGQDGFRPLRTPLPLPAAPDHVPGPCREPCYPARPMS